MSLTCTMADLKHLHRARPAGESRPKFKTLKEAQDAGWYSRRFKEQPGLSLKGFARTLRGQGPGGDAGPRFSELDCSPKLAKLLGLTLRPNVVAQVRDAQQRSIAHKALTQMKNSGAKRAKPAAEPKKKDRGR